jgi:hypothetical protein
LIALFMTRARSERGKYNRKVLGRWTHIIFLTGCKAIPLAAGAPIAARLALLAVVVGLAEAVLALQDASVVVGALIACLLLVSVYY